MRKSAGHAYRQASGIWRPYGVQKVSYKERLKIRKRRVRLFSLTAGVVAGLASVVLLAVASHAPRFQIQSVQIIGNQAVSERVIQAVVNTVLYDGRFLPFSTHSVLFFKRDALEHTLKKQLPQLASAHVSLTSLKGGVVQVEVDERVPYALWCHAYRQAGPLAGRAGDEDGMCYVLDEHGFIFTERGGDPLVRDEIFYGGLIRAHPIGRWFLPSYFEEVMRTVMAVEQVYENVVAVEVINEHEYRMQVASGVFLLARFNSDASTLAENLKITLSSDVFRERGFEVEYIDLRFGNRVYYK